MEISKEVQALTALVGQFSGRGLKDEQHFQMLLQFASERGRNSLVGDLAFKAKYLRRLFETLGKLARDDAHFPKLQQEFMSAVHEMRNLLTEFLTDAPLEFQAAMSDRYLQFTETGFANLLRLADDFMWLKNWQLAYLESGDEQPDHDET